MRPHLASLRTRWAAIGAAVAVTIGAAGISGYNIVNADVATGDRPVFIPLNPCRMVDTRPGDANVGAKSSPLGPDETITVTAHGSNGNCTGPSAIPTDAVGLSLNVTAVGQTQRTFLTIWGEGADPGTSNLNPEPGQPPTPNAVNTPLSATGTFNVRNNAGFVNTLIDVVGYYANHNHDDRYYTQTQTDSTSVRSSACAPTDFYPGDDRIAYRGSGSRTVTTSSLTRLFCTLSVPNGAAMTGLRVHLRDDDVIENAECDILFWDGGNSGGSLLGVDSSSTGYQVLEASFTGGARTLPSNTAISLSCRITSSIFLSHAFVDYVVGPASL